MVLISTTPFCQKNLLNQTHNQEKISLFRARFCIYFKLKMSDYSKLNVI